MEKVPAASLCLKKEKAPIGALYIFRTGLCFGYFEAFHIGIDAMQLAGDVDTLRAVGTAPVAAYAMTRLAKLGHTAVVAHKEGPACAAIALVLRRQWHIALVEAFVIVPENGRYIKAVRAGHAIFAIGARN